MFQNKQETSTYSSSPTNGENMYVTNKARLYYDLLAEWLKETYSRNKQDSRILVFLKEEYKNLYSSIKMPITERDEQEKSEKGKKMERGERLDIKNYRFENLVKNIKERLRGEEPSEKLWENLRVRNRIFLENPFLGIIYDYSNLNSYGQSVMKYGSMTDASYYGFLTIDPGKLKDLAVKQRAMRELISEAVRRPAVGVVFIFWALFVLTVDNTDFEERLRDICDLAELMGVPEVVLQDIMDVINVIYRAEKPEEVQFRSGVAKAVFEDVVGMYGLYEVN